MSNLAILYYVIQILIILAQTSDMPAAMKQIRVDRLAKLAKEIVVDYD